ncbi:MAG: MBL fold metallo-hydrolase [Chloroflexi bacterium]|nr:MAG: MBL fold metallo-hydrolase [Chloroflexota bacterium]MBL1195805.1 MBL fold metallo-hydrolase [Chloroflexota bacterium]NOH13096.1 MBL fold metallo-hydrolase [Chloroflexota bacterium]
MVEQVLASRHQVKSFESAGGARIFQMPLEAFPSFWVHSYLVIVDDYRVLIDTGSNFPQSNEGLEKHLESISAEIGESLGLADLTHIFVTHGHIDHFGGLAYVKPLTDAKVGIHELDRRNLTNYEERLVVVAQRLTEFLLESGASPERVEELKEMYMFSKALFNSVEVDFTYEAEGMQIGPFDFLHVPGHCAGMVCIKLHDILFSADHVLAGISPHQAPERLTLNTGLGHYLESLQACRAWASDVGLILGGHRRPIENLGKRIDEIVAEHQQRLEKVIEMLSEPQTIAQVAQELFGETEGYNDLLAIEEAGAHVEYLYQRGYLGISNLDEYRQTDLPVPILYQCLDAEIDFDKLINLRE